MNDPLDDFDNWTPDLLGELVRQLKEAPPGDIAAVPAVWLVGLLERYLEAEGLKT